MDFYRLAFGRTTYSAYQDAMQRAKEDYKLYSKPRGILNTSVCQELDVPAGINPYDFVHWLETGEITTQIDLVPAETLKLKKGMAFSIKIGSQEQEAEEFLAENELDGEDGNVYLFFGS